MNWAAFEQNLRAGSLLSTKIPPCRGGDFCDRRLAESPSIADIFPRKGELAPCRRLSNLQALRTYRKPPQIRYHLMSSSTEVAIIGAGPYGLSIAAYLRDAGIPFQIFGKPMYSWRSR